MTSRPADFRFEVAEYDRHARVSTWDGPRYRLRYRERGEGPPLVLVPGIASTYRGYALLLNLLATRFRTILYDYPGENPGDGANLAKIGHVDLVSDLVGLIDHLKIAQATPIGVSFGSTVTLRALSEHPDRFPRAILQGGFAFRSFPAVERLALRLGRLVPGTVDRLPFRGPVLARHARADFGPEISDRWPDYLRENGRTPIASMAHRIALLTRLDLRPILPRIDREVLLIHGDRDRIVSLRDFETLASGLPRARPKLLLGAGHQLHYTDAERFAAEVIRFLDESP